MSNDGIMELWNYGIMELWSIGVMKEYTKRRNLNRGYMKLEVCNNAIEDFK